MNGKSRPPSGRPTPPARSIADLYATALGYHQAGRLPAAEGLFRRILTADPGHADSWHGLGIIACQLGRYDAAIGPIEKAIALNRQAPVYHHSLGEALQAAGRLKLAIACYERALALNPGYVEAHGNLGNVLMKFGRVAEAAACYERLLVLNPNLVAGHNNLGNALAQQGKLDDAIGSYRRAIEIRPDFAEAHHNLADAYQIQGRLAEAVAAYEQALSLRPDLAEAHNNLGSVLQMQGKRIEAMQHYQQAVALRPGFAEAQLNFAVLLHKQGEANKAVLHCEQALALMPDFPAARFALCMMQLPFLYLDEQEIGVRRAAYRRHLSALCDYADRSKPLARLAPGVGTHQPFLLAYQGLNDHELQSVYGSLVCRIMAEAYPPASLPQPPGCDEPVRVGFVSGYFLNHSNWKIPIKGWLTQLDRRRFELYGYHTGNRHDSATEEAASLCHRFVRGPLSDARWREAILADAPHVLIFPEVGMDPVSVRLAAQRLAPVQCNSWGHPETSGFPTLDYFLNSDLMEPPGAKAHYTERLVRLPNLSVYCDPPEAAPLAVSRSDLGLRATATVYWCGQSLFKYLPQHDHVLPLIARGAGDCQFVFIEYPDGAAANEQFRTRLERAFSALGLPANEHCVVLPRLDQAKFAAAAGQCDVVLDSIGWSGCNSTLEVLAHDLPTVTMETALMRGRHSMAILRMMGVSETITGGLEEYVSVAVRLARDSAWRLAIKSKIRDNKHRVYRDLACISALEEFLGTAARTGVGVSAVPSHPA